MTSKLMVSIGAALLALPVALPAQTPAPAATAATPAPKLTTGAAVSDTKGGAVGTIASIEGDFATLDTGTNKVRLPTSSFAMGATGPIIAMTKAEVDAAVTGAAEKDKAALAAMLTPGTKVSDQHGGAVGTIEANDGQFVTVATAKSKVKLPASAFAKGTTGPVIAMTAAELDAAAKSSAPAAPKG